MAMTAVFRRDDFAKVVKLIPLGQTADRFVDGRRRRLRRRRLWRADTHTMAAKTFVAAIAAACGVVGLGQLNAPTFDALGLHTVLWIAVWAKLVIAFAFDTLALVALPVAGMHRIGCLAVGSGAAQIKVAARFTRASVTLFAAAAAAATHRTSTQLVLRVVKPPSIFTIAVLLLGTSCRQKKQQQQNERQVHTRDRRRFC